MRVILSVLEAISSELVSLIMTDLDACRKEVAGRVALTKSILDW